MYTMDTYVRVDRCIIKPEEMNYGQYYNCKQIEILKYLHCLYVTFESII